MQVFALRGRLAGPVVHHVGVLDAPGGDDFARGVLDEERVDENFLAERVEADFEGAEFFHALRIEHADGHPFGGLQLRAFGKRDRPDGADVVRAEAAQVSARLVRGRVGEQRRGDGHGLDGLFDERVSAFAEHAGDVVEHALDLGVGRVFLVRFFKGHLGLAIPLEAVFHEALAPPDVGGIMVRGDELLALGERGGVALRGEKTVRERERGLGVVRRGGLQRGEDLERLVKFVAGLKDAGPQAAERRGGLAAGIAVDGGKGGVAAAALGEFTDEVGEGFVVVKSAVENGGETFQSALLVAADELRIGALEGELLMAGKLVEMPVDVGQGFRGLAEFERGFHVVAEHGGVALFRLEGALEPGQRAGRLAGLVVGQAEVVPDEAVGVPVAFAELGEVGRRGGFGVEDHAVEDFVEHLGVGLDFFVAPRRERVGETAAAEDADAVVEIQAFHGAFAGEGPAAQRPLGAVLAAAIGLLPDVDADAAAEGGAEGVEVRLGFAGPDGDDIKAALLRTGLHAEFRERRILGQRFPAAFPGGARRIDGVAKGRRAKGGGRLPRTDGGDAFLVEDFKALAETPAGVADQLRRVPFSPGHELVEKAVGLDDPVLEDEMEAAHVHVGFEAEAVEAVRAFPALGGEFYIALAAQPGFDDLQHGVIFERHAGHFLGDDHGEKLRLVVQKHRAGERVDFAAVDCGPAGRRGDAKIPRLARDGLAGRADGSRAAIRAAPAQAHDDAADQKSREEAIEHERGDGALAPVAEVLRTEFREADDGQDGARDDAAEREQAGDHHHHRIRRHLLQRHDSERTEQPASEQNDDGQRAFFARRRFSE